MSENSEAAVRYPAKADVVIVGAGLAGLSCAIEILHKQPNLKVVLLEERSVVGGRTSCWNEQGMHIETGLHRFLGFYTALPKLLTACGLKLGDVVFWEDEIEIRLPDGGPKAVFGAAPLNRPFQTIAGALGNNHLISFCDKLSFVKFFLNGFVDYMVKPEYLDSIDLKDYAIEKGLTKTAYDRVIGALAAGLFWIPPHRYSAYGFFAMFFGFWTQLYRFRMGAFQGGMTDVMTRPLANWIQEHGGQVITNSRVDELIVRSLRDDEDAYESPTHQVTGVRIGDKIIHADHVVLATTVGAAKKLVRPKFEDLEWFKPMLKLPMLTGITIQLDLKHPSMKVDHTTFGPFTCMASFAEQSRTTFKERPGRISILLTPPEKYLAMEHDEIFEEVLRDAQRLDLSITRDSVLGYRIVELPESFYMFTAGTESLRPKQKTPVKGFYLAGDYTRQRYQSTMEGAVVSGKYAGEAVLEAYKSPSIFCILFALLVQLIRYFRSFLFGCCD